MSKRVILSALICSLGGLVFGYDLGALSSASQSLREFFHLAPGYFGFTISASLWGTVCGSLLAGAYVDRLGRRRLLFICAFIYFVAALGLAFPLATGWHSVLALRFFAGTTIGGFTVGCPLYLAELSPRELRGRLVTLFQVQVGVGVVIAFTLGALLIRIAPPGSYWRWCFGIGGIPAGLMLAFLPMIPRDPRGIIAHAAESSDREALFQRKYLRPLLWATSIAVFNQLSGVNILLLYLLDVLSSAGLGHFLGHTYTVWISCLGLASTFIGLIFVDRAGRRPLLILGSIGMFACLTALAAAIPRQMQPAWYLAILAAYNLCFAFSQGTVVWVYLSELFPPAVRGAGQGYGATVHWIANAVLIWIFPVIEHALPSVSFYGLALLMLVQIAVVWLWYPETKGTALGAAV